LRKWKAKRLWKKADVHKMKGFGATQLLEITPLVDWYTSREGLRGELGVSYLIRTDKDSILFDVGHNAKQQDPSPLLNNMKQLGLTLNDFNSIVISHNHEDHVGGMKWKKMRSFSLTSHQINLDKKSIYTPVPMTYPGLYPTYAKDPTVISEGAVTIGTIWSPLFFLGWVSEQALAINVKGKGVVVIIGCGHQTLEKILSRVEDLFDEPFWGFIGGLHYPATDSRVIQLGIKRQRYVGSGKPPWDPPTMDDVRENIDKLRKRNPKLIALSAHDSCDASIAAFRSAFPNAFKEIKVGEKITV